MSKGPAKPVPQVTEDSRPYWEGAQQGRLMIQRCRGTGKAFMYARRWSPFDYSADPAWEAASGRGTVYSYSIVHQAPYAAFAAQVPYVLAIIELEEGPRMMANILGCAPEAVHVGMPVKVCFEDRDGFKLPQFEPA